MSMLKEFREFAMRGNVVDMAVGVIIGVAFGKIITSLVNDIIMPPIGLLLGGADFNSLKIDLGNARGTQQIAAVKYGAFVNTIIDFLIVALAIFFLLKVINAFMTRAKTTTKECPECLSTIPINAKRCKCCTASLPPRQSFST